MLTYFLQVNVCWLLFYGAYYALLSKETFFRLNRMWLIASLLCGLALPFVADYFAIKVVPTNLFVATLEPFVVTATALQHDWTVDTEGVVLRCLAVGYLIGVVALANRFFAGLFLIFKLFLQSKKEKKDGFTLVNTEGVCMPPFSFFTFIFINPDTFDSADYQQIMQHEEAHVRQRHSFDVVFMELLNIVFWCSPLVYFYKESLRNVHEYLADAAVLRTNTTPQYGRLLLRQQQSNATLWLTSNISNQFFSQLKKRILMMTRNPSRRRDLVKYALAAPIFLILTMVLASPKTPILAKTEVFGAQTMATIDNFEKKKWAEFNALPSNIQNGNTRFPNMKEGDIAFYVGNYRNGGKITASEMKKVKKLNAFQIVKGAEVACEIKSFVLVRVAGQQDPIQVNVSGATNDEFKKVVDLAQEGDMFQFFNVIGIDADNTSKTRDLGSMSLLVVSNSANIDEPSKQNRTDSLPKIKEGETILYVGNNNQGGKITASELQKIDKVNAFMMLNGKSEEATIQSYVVVRVPRKKDQDPQQVNVTGGGVSEPLKKLFGMAEAGDQFQFFQIKGRWAGDGEVRNLGSLSLLVKDDGASTKPVPNNIDPNDIKSMNVNKDEVKGNSVTIEMKDGTIYVLQGEELERWKKENEQNRVKIISDQKPIYTVVDQNPEFPQGTPALFKWLGQNIKYPETARKAKGEGTVYVGFVVEKDGAITNVAIKRDAPFIVRDTITLTEINGVKANKVIEKTDYALGKEAVRVISAMPKWKAGSHKGVPVRVAYTLPIKFKLE
jgi:BlaR1 peptidase M56/Gram-negative bacterial TonB protein C-terminal